VSDFPNPFFLEKEKIAPGAKNEFLDLTRWCNIARGAIV
jgi:hypothetical protein